MSEEFRVEVQCAARNPIFVSISEYRREKRLDVRHYYTGDDGRLHPTKKGISIPLDSAMELVVALEEASPPRDNTATLVQVSIDVREPICIKIAPYKNVMRLDVRHYYEEAGELKPGAKGINLQWSDHQALLNALYQATAEPVA
jgi:hypothetical protein